MFNANDDMHIEANESEQRIENEQINQMNDVEGPEVRYAGFWMRFWAYLVDLIIIGSIVRLLVNPLFRFFDISLNSFQFSVKYFAPVSIVSALIFYGYFVLMTFYFRQTIGKMIFGLKVISLKGERLTLGTVLIREWIGRFISIKTWVGYLIIAFLPRKQGVHDLFSDTTVIHER